MTTEQKAVQACADYVRINKEIKRIGQEIGEALLCCPVSRASYSEGATHLKEYYANVNAGGYISSHSHRVEGQDEFEACPHCMAAHKLIQDRKSARRSLGAVKRRITQIGINLQS